MQIVGLLIFFFAAVGFVFLFLFLKKQMSQDIESKFSKLSQEALKASSEQFLLLAKQTLGAEQKQAQADLELRKQSVEKSVDELKDELEKYRKLIHEFEQDRAKKYGNIETELQKTSQLTTTLQDTTNRLTNVLGNTKLRGQWGERMAEDIILNCGLIEGINFRKQKKLDSASTKPDYTFFLPDKHSVNMDVKFPLDNYIQMTNADNEAQREQFKKEFLNNVKMRIKEIQNRAYINPEEETLDFVLLFIPNEQVFGFIQENFPGLVDEALKQKVVLCSPFTLYAMLCVIRQAFENFRYEKATKEIVKMIDLFAKSYDIFKRRFDDIGKSIEKLEGQYNEVKTTSFKELDTKIRRIEDYKKGNTPAIENKGNTMDVRQNDFENEHLVS